MLIFMGVRHHRPSLSRHPQKGWPPSSSARLWASCGVSRNILLNTARDHHAQPPPRPPPPPRSAAQNRFHPVAGGLSSYGGGIHSGNSWVNLASVHHHRVLPTSDQFIHHRGLLGLVPDAWRCLRSATGGSAAGSWRPTAATPARHFCWMMSARADPPRSSRRSPHLPSIRQGCSGSPGIGVHARRVPGRRHRVRLKPTATIPATPPLAVPSTGCVRSAAHDPHHFGGCPRPFNPPNSASSWVMTSSLSTLLAAALAPALSHSICPAKYLLRAPRHETPGTSRQRFPPTPRSPSPHYRPLAQPLTARTTVNVSALICALPPRPTGRPPATAASLPLGDGPHAVPADHAVNGEREQGRAGGGGREIRRGRVHGWFPFQSILPQYVRLVRCPVSRTVTPRHNVAAPHRHRDALPWTENQISAHRPRRPLQLSRQAPITLKARAASDGPRSGSLGIEGAHGHISQPALSAASASVSSAQRASRGAVLLGEP